MYFLLFSCAARIHRTTWMVVQNMPPLSHRSVFGCALIIFTHQGSDIATPKPFTASVPTDCIFPITVWLLALKVTHVECISFLDLNWRRIVNVSPTSFLFATDSLLIKYGLISGKHNSNPRFQSGPSVILFHVDHSTYLWPQLIASLYVILAKPFSREAILGECIVGLRYFRNCFAEKEN
jgi:hypothetical protein